MTASAASWTAVTLQGVHSAPVPFRTMLRDIATALARPQQAITAFAFISIPTRHIFLTFVRAIIEAIIVLKDTPSSFVLLSIMLFQDSSRLFCSLQILFSHGKILLGANKCHRIQSIRVGETV